MAVGGGTITTLTTTSDITVQGLTVGRGAGAVSSNTAVGASALAGSNSGTGQNTAVGYQAGLVNTTGAYGTFIGRLAGSANTTGNENTAIGNYSLPSNTTGINNVAVGSQALAANTVSSKSVAVGYQAGNTTYNGDGQTLVGYQAGYALTNGSYVSTFIGYQAGIAMTSGNRNTILGSYSGNQGGLDIRTGNNNIVLSDGDGNPRGSYRNVGSNYSWVFSQNATTIALNASECVQIDATSSNYGLFINNGSSGGTPVRFWSTSQQAGSITTGANTTSYNSGSDYRLKKDVQPMVSALERVLQLSPVIWKWTSDDSHGEGFIAHELQAVVPVAVYGEKDATHEDGSINPQQVDTSYLVAMLTASIQELKAEFDAYKATHP
jgi:hypothetical protein